MCVPVLRIMQKQMPKMQMHFSTFLTNKQIPPGRDLCNTQLEELAALCDETVAHERSAAWLVADEATARAGIEAECAAWRMDVWTVAADHEWELPKCALCSLPKNFYANAQYVLAPLNACYGAVIICGGINARCTSG